MQDVDERTEPRSEGRRYAVAKLNRALCRGIGPGYSVRIREPVAVPDWPEADPPEIDIAVVVDKFYRAIPTCADALVFIEVSDAAYADVRARRIPRYVQAGVQSWIVNVPSRQVEAYDSAADLELPHGNVFTEYAAFQLLGLTIPVAFLFDVTNRP
jgi:hypothetical protein